MAAVESGEYQIACLVTFAQSGKALALDTPIATPNGWSAIGGIRIGDFVFGSSGEPVRVVTVSPVAEGHACFAVDFDDGETIVADADHFWSVTAVNNAGRNPRPAILTTRQMVERGIIIGDRRSRFMVPLAAALRLPAIALSVDPWLLGAWLGDGNARAAAITVGNEDLSEMLRLLAAAGVAADPRPAGSCWRVHVTYRDLLGRPDKSRDGSTVKRALRLLGLIANKHIPPTYLRASAEQRLALLQGLMDTDGGVDGHTAVFCSKPEGLARQVVELAASLGYRPRLHRHAAGHWLVAIKCYRETTVFRLPRKTAALRSLGDPKARPDKNRRRSIVAIRPVASVPVRCIGVDADDHLYLAGRTMIPTHNTDGMLDLIGARLDQRPTPIIYVGPSKEFNVDQFEPRLGELFAQAKGLGAKVAPGKRNKKTLKWVSGVRLRLAHAGSSTALKSDPAALALIDEYDEMAMNVRGQGDPLGLVKARGDTYADFAIAVASTPGQGFVDVAYDEKSGLEFWLRGDAEEVQSRIWRLYQQGTMYHWTWSCPLCAAWFVPRFKLLRWPKGASPAEAISAAWIECPHCHGAIGEEHKASMNATAVALAPGQWVEDGVVQGEPVASTIFSLWASGLCSPFQSWGERASDYLNAEAEGDPQKMQTVFNASFGELFAPGSGEVPEWREVMALRLPYEPGTIPAGVAFLTAAVDVQKNRLVFAIRGWGERATSWLIDAGELWGPTEKLEVWAELDDLLSAKFDGRTIKVAFIDSGFRPGKKEVVPEHRVYEFCRAHQRFVFPCKGTDTMSSPFIRRRIEVNPQGGAKKYGLELIRLSTDYWKLWVHERIRWPTTAPGAWHLHEKTSEDYCKQIVAEARTKTPAGRPVWVQRSRENHYFDCFDPATELLTKSGWVPVAAASDGMEFATVDLSTDLIEYQEPTRIIEREHRGEMVEIKGRSIDLLVTPNHRMVTTRANPIDDTPMITLAGDLTIWHKLKRSAQWNGIVPASPAGDVGDWFEFLGWFVSEGHRIERGRNCRVVISQNPGEKHDRIRALLDRIGFPCSDHRQMGFSSEVIFRALDDCYESGSGRGAYRKRVPDFVKCAPPDLIARFVEAAILGDGWQQGTFRSFATTSQRLADDMQELFIKLGRSANVVIRPPGLHRIRGREGTTVAQYYVSEIKTPAALLRRADNTALFRRVPYDGMVHCVSVANGTLIARRNGKAVIIGNCECMNAAAAYMLGAQRIGSRYASKGDAGEVARAAAIAASAPAPAKPGEVPAKATSERFRDFAARMTGRPAT